MAVSTAMLRLSRSLASAPVEPFGVAPAVATRSHTVSSQTCDKSWGKLDFLACRRSKPHNHEMGVSLTRRMASLLFALAFVVSVQAYALPRMPAANSDMAVAGMMHGPNAVDCNGCSHDDVMAMADCKATCVPAIAIAPDAQIEKQVHMDLASMWKSDRAATRETAPDTTPPRS